MKRVLLAVAVLVLSAVPAQARESLGNFSADIESTTQQGAVTMKLYSSGLKSRMEMADGNIVIVRRDKGVMWMLMTGQGFYMEQPLDIQMAQQSTPDVEGEVSRTPMGKEIVNGRNADKFKVDFEAQGQRGEIYQWLDGEMPIRTQAVDGTWSVDFKNIQKGPQSDSMFEVPAGLQKMAVPTMDEILKNAGQ